MKGSFLGLSSPRRTKPHACMEILLVAPNPVFLPAGEVGRGFWRKVSRNFYVTAVVRKGRESGGHLGGLHVIVQGWGRMPEARGKAAGMDHQRPQCMGSCKYDPEFELCPVSNRTF